MASSWATSSLINEDVSISTGRKQQYINTVLLDLHGSVPDCNHHTISNTVPASSFEPSSQSRVDVPPETEAFCNISGRLYYLNVYPSSICWHLICPWTRSRSSELEGGLCHFLCCKCEGPYSTSSRIIRALAILSRPMWMKLNYKRSKKRARFLQRSTRRGHSKKRWDAQGFLTE